MPQTLELQPFDRTNSEHIRAATDVWNSAVNVCLTISADFLAYNATPATGLSQEGALPCSTAIRRALSSQRSAR